MKIFNWVHRKFHHQDGKKEFVAINGTEKQVLLECAVVAADVFDGWRDGSSTILAIGTLGIGPWSEYPNQRNEFPVVEAEDEEEQEEDCNTDDEERRAVVDDDLREEENGMEECDHEEDEEEVIPLVPRAAGNGSHCDENAPLVVSDICEVAGFEVGDNKIMMKQRTTLADLFLADSDIIHTKRDGGRNPQPDDSEKKNKKKKKQKQKKQPADVDTKKKGRLSFAKKLIPHAGDQKDSRPIKQLHQLMRRMLNRKIHPNFDGKFENMESQLMNPTQCGLLAEENGATESVFLLQTCDATA